MSTTVSPPPRSSLLGLPLELRQMIYNFVFADDETGDVLIKSRPDSDGIGRTHSDSFVEYHSFTLVNREVHAEVDEWYFTHSRFRFEGQGDAFGLKDFVARVPKKYLQRITRISITYFSLEHMLREQGDARRNKFLTLRRCLNLSLPQMRAFLAAENPAAPPPTDRDAINFFFRDFQLAIDGYNNVRQTVNILNSFPLLKYLDLGMYLSECCVIEGKALRVHREFQILPMLRDLNKSDTIKDITIKIVWMDAVSKGRRWIGTCDLDSKDYSDFPGMVKDV